MSRQVAPFWLPTDQVGMRGRIQDIRDQLDPNAPDDMR